MERRKGESRALAVRPQTWLAAGVVLHGAGLALMGWRAGNVPVTDFAQSLSFLAWLIAVSTLILVRRAGMAVIGTFAAPAAVLLTVLALLLNVRAASTLPAALRSLWLPIHVTMAFLGDALFALGAAVSFLYLAHESRLKAKRPILAVGGQPSLERLDRLNYRLLGLGFLMLTLAITSGALWAGATWGRYWSWEPQELWSLVTWVLYGALLEARLAAGWRGRRAATLTIAAFVVLAGSFVGVSLAFPGRHGGSFG